MIRDNAKQYNENYKISLRKVKDDWIRGEK